jgi:putative phosphotransacetylase
MHVTQEGLEILFGKGAKLEVHKWLYQEGQFASTATVTLIGPRRRIIPNLRILGPCRNLTQIELSITDAVQLGIDIPVKASGDIEGTPGGWVMGPAGMLEMKNGIIRAARHVHMHPDDASFYGVKHLDHMKMRVTSQGCSTLFEDMLVRVDKSFKLEVHIDTDEANACNLEAATRVELVR